MEMDHFFTLQKENVNFAKNKSVKTEPLTFGYCKNKEREKKKNYNFWNREINMKMKRTENYWKP